MATTARVFHGRKKVMRIIVHSFPMKNKSVGGVKSETVTILHLKVVIINALCRYAPVRTHMCRSQKSRKPHAVCYMYVQTRNTFYPRDALFYSRIDVYTLKRSPPSWNSSMTSTFFSYFPRDTESIHQPRCKSHSQIATLKQKPRSMFCFWTRVTPSGDLVRKRPSPWWKNDRDTLLYCFPRKISGALFLFFKKMYEVSMETKILLFFGKITSLIKSRTHDHRKCHRPARSDRSSYSYLLVWLINVWSGVIITVLQ